MKNPFTLLSLCCFLCQGISAQDLGYRTTDIGAEFQKYPHGSFYRLQAAFNGKRNHSLNLKFGYNRIPAYNTGTHTESGQGWGGGIGYRYYFNPASKKFFVGGGIDTWIMKMDFEDNCPCGPAVYLKTSYILQPQVETGYTFLINELFYLTPYISGQFQIGVRSSKLVDYGRKFVPAAGMNAGIRF